MADSNKDARGRIADALNDRLSPEQVELLVNEILAINKIAWATFKCKDCGKQQRQQVEIPDARAVTSALVDLSNQAWGRPSDVQAEDLQLVVNRHVYVVGEPDPEEEQG